MAILDNEEKEIEILIVVKTYPVISKSYNEVVCTAGIDKYGNWYRIYPIRYRYLDDTMKFKKYSIINIKIKKAELSKDIRRESYRVVSDDFTICKILETHNYWQERKDWLDKIDVYESKEEIISKNKKNELSLCKFKPKEVIDFSWKEEAEREYNKEKQDILIKSVAELDLFDTTDDINFIKKNPLKKLPYKFYYTFIDTNDEESKLMIEDWEIGALYWNLIKKNNEKQTLNKIREQYMKFTNKKNYDLSLFLGTTKEHDGSYRKSKNPFLIVGLLPIPINNQMSFL